MSGCTVCVYDLYDEAMEQYREGIERVKVRLREMGVGEGEWPVALGAGENGREGGQPERVRASVVMDAFEQLERQLAEKRKRESDGVS